MKRLGFVFVLCLILSVGCSSDTKRDNEKNDKEISWETTRETKSPSPTKESSDKEDDFLKETSNPIQTNEKNDTQEKKNIVNKNKKSKKLEDLEKYLGDFCAGKRTEMAADMIGAERGFKYKSDSFSFEVYEYNIKGDSYKDLINKGKVYIEDMDIEMEFSAINGKFALLLDEKNNHKKNKRLLKRFNEF